MYAGLGQPGIPWLLCDGTAYSRTTYAALFAIIGVLYGAGDGSTTFNVPDMRGRFPQGSNATDAVGAKGGQAVADIGQHTHGISGHNHTFSMVYAVNTTVSGGAQTRVTDINGQTGSGGTSATATTNSSGALTTGNPTGSIAAPENRPPFLALNYIIKT